MGTSDITEKIKALPQNPGVYIFRDAEGKIIYIGKATDLKSRVGSYFRNYHGSDRPIETMIHQVKDIEAEETDSVLDALILEANLIKKHQPKYNVLGKDDKSYAYFAITKEEFPRVLILRETDMRIPGRSDLQRERREAADGSPIRQRLSSSDGLIKGTFGPYTSKKQMEIALKIIRKIFPFHSNKNKTEKGCLDFQLGRCPGPYAGAISKKDYAKNIRGIRMILEGKKKNLVSKLEKEMQALAGNDEFERAAEVRNKIFALKHIQDIALINRDNDFKFEILNLKSNPNDKILKLEKKIRIEAYDISNLSGLQAVGSMVVFEGGAPNKKEYRKFKIKTVDGSNDVAMMREVLSRRFNNPWAQPDLILLDGGQGHLNMAEKLLHGLGFVIPLASVAKGPERKNLELRISNPGVDTGIGNILNDKNLIKSIMDEAHRFAIGYHRKIRKREFV